MQEIKAILVGCGAMAGGWIAPAKQTPDLRLVGLVDLNRATAEALATKYELPADIVFDSLDQAIAQTDANAVFDVTVPPAHHHVTLQALRAGLHVLGEKPMSDSLPHAREMVAAATKANRTYAVIQNRRFDPSIRTVRQTLQSGQIGDIAEIHADFFIAAHFGGFRNAMDYPLILDMAIHTFDAARFLGCADPVGVYCHSFNPSHSWYKGDASAIVIFEMTNNILFSYRGSWCSEGLHTPWESNWRVVGSKGSLTWDGAQQIKAQSIKPDAKPAFLSELQDLPITPLTLEHTGHAALIRQFVHCLQTNTPPETTCTDNIKSLAMVHAAVQSARTGKKVPVVW